MVWIVRFNVRLQKFNERFWFFVMEKFREGVGIDWLQRICFGENRLDISGRNINTKTNDKIRVMINRVSFLHLKKIISSMYVYNEKIKKGKYWIKK